MNQFRITALGSHFDVDAYLESATMTPSTIWRWRDADCKEATSATYPMNGIAFDLGDGAKTPICEQEDIAIDFLKSNRDALRSLSKFPGVTHFSLGLHDHRSTQGDFIGICPGASVLLMWHMLHVRCTLSTYVSLELAVDGDES